MIVKSESQQGRYFELLPFASDLVSDALKIQGCRAINLLADRFKGLKGPALKTNQTPQAGCALKN
jgi:hypothetical protein